MLIIVRYCEEVKLFLENAQIQKIFTLQYARAIEIKRKRSEREEKR
jgi:hypothetical protein